jgi:RHS repeat-associated protein
VVYDAQLLAVSGEILATILNRGPNSTPAAFAVSFFEDRNLNRQYDPTIDALVGSTVIRHPLAGGETATVTASLSGQVLFAGSPVYAFVDSTNAIEETIESNNVGRDLHEFVPAVGVFDPQLEWAWTSSSIQPSSLNVMNTPVVIDLNQDGTPDVVFGSTASTGGGSVEVGIVRALNGLNGTELFSIANSDFLINTAASLAAGDIDGDGVPEIIATDSSGSRLIAFNNSGDFLWRTPQLESINWGAPALADLDNDGSIEIIIGRQVINNDGTLRWTGAGGRAYVAGPISLVADVDLNGSPEIVAGNTLYNSQGSIIWQNNIPDGHNAIGNFDDDDYAEIVLVSGGNVYLFEHNGTLKWGPVGIPGGGSGGPPTVADYDGDGEPEVGVAGARRYVVLETDGSIKWQSVTQDASSNVTGSSVFDFEGDGRAEVVYRDELRLRVYDGIDGTVRWEVPMSSCTWHEYAYVVDVDGDGNAEILTTANNNCGLGPQRGVFVYGSASDSWVDTRDIWNQHTYHINNVNDDGTIPQIEQPSWLTHNSYRLNTLTDAVSVRLAPDLTASWLRIAQSESDVQLTARIGNGGSTFSPAGVSVAFYNGNPTVGGTLLGTTNVGRLDPGCFQDISFTVPADGVTDIWVVADDDGAGRGTVGESSETNNILHAGLALQPVNQEPTITSTPLLNAVEGRVYSYNVTADDPDVNLPITYSLHVAPNGMQIDVGAGEITWTPDSRDSGSHAVQVIATDARGGRAIQVFAVTVAGDLNTSPEITSSAVTVANVGEMYRYSLMAIDAEGDDLTYSLLSAPAGMRIYPDFGIVEWIPLHEQLGIHGVTIRVEDGQGGADIQVFEITATKPNTPPIFSSTPPSTAVLNRPLKYQVRLQDADSDSITVTLADGSVGNLVQRERGYYFEWTPTDSDVTAGTRSVTILANDGLGGVSEQTFSLAVLASSTNAAPVITSTPRTVAYPGGTYNYYVTANDPDRDRLVFELIEGPTGMTISSEGLVAWSPTGDVGQSYVVQIVVSDGQGGSTEQEFDLQIASQLVNTAPVIASNPPWTARDGRAYVYDAQAVDAEGDPVRWSLDTAPIGMSVDADTGQVRWIPSNDQLGMHSVTLRAFDPLGASTVQSFSINTMCANTPPLITSTPLTQAFVGDPYFYAVRAVDPDGDPLEFSLVSGPAGLTISSAGLIRWTPSAIDEGQQRSVAVRADDGQGGFVIQQYQIAVAPATSQNRPPVITSTPEFSVTVGDTYDYIVTAIDPDGDTLVYSLLVKPDWMSIDPQTGAITGTAVSVGAESVVVQVSDGTSVATQGFSVNVRLNSAPVITSPPITSITAGGTYRYTVRANDPDGDPLTYRLTQAPDGMTIDQNGRIVWSATAGVTAPQPVTVTVSDDRGQTATQSYSITMLADTEAPRVFLSVYTSDSAFGSQATLNIGAVYTVQVSATDNVGVQTVGLMVDGQAVTLTANGTVTLTASSLGTVQLLAFATDAAGLRGEASGSATISNPGQGFQPNPSDPGLPPNPGPDPSDSGQPIVEITSPEPGTAVTNRVPIIGTVDDPENNLWYYRAYYARADRVSITNIDLEDADWTVFHQSTQEVINGELAVFDASNLTNDAYAIIVAGFDVNGRGYAAPTLVYVEGNLVLGNFRLEFTDLSIPLVGIPIQVSRVYDTLNAQDEGDFGFGWTLGVQDARIVEALAIGPGGAFNGGNNKFVPDKTKVYLTNPFGKRVGFTYKEQLLSASLFGGIWRPYFEPDPGVYDTLTIDETQVARGGIIGALAQGINPSNYTLTTREGMKYRYSDTQGLQTITDRNGNVVTYTSSGIRHSSGQEIQFVRDHRGRIKQIVDPLGNTIVYTFSHEGDLVLVRDQVDAITNFAYRSDVPHYLDSVTDPFGRVGVRTEYNQDGRLTRFIDINGRPTSFEYDPQALLEERIDGLGNKHIILYDSQGNIARYVDPLGNETFFEYDESNNLTRRTDALGNTTTHTYDSLGNRLSTTTAHSSDQNPADFTTTFTYNSRGQQTSVIGPSGGGIFLEYDNRGNQTKIIDIDGSVIAFSEFDAAGNEVKSGDMLGFTTYVYDSAGNAIETTDSNGDTYFAEYDASGQVTVLTYEDGRQYERTYDGKGRVLTEGFIGGNKTTYKYENGDDWVSFSDEQIGEVTRLTNGDGSFRGWSIDGVDQLQIEYNAAGQATVETDAAGNETKYEYDPSGRLTSVTGPTDAKSTREYDAAGRIIRETDAAGHSTRFTYDQSGRLASVTNALDHRWDYSYTTNSVTIEDPLGNRTTSLLTPDGLHAGTVLPDGRRTSTDYLLRSQLADAEEYPTRVIATDGRMTLYGYDGNGNLETVTLSDGATYRYSYGTDTILYRSPNGDEISIQTDDVSGRETITFPDGGVQTLFYQSSSGAIHVQPVTVTQPSGTTISNLYSSNEALVQRTTSTGIDHSFEYDVSGSLTTYSDATGETRQFFDQNNQLIRIEYPNGGSIAYGRNILGQITRIDVWASTVGAALTTTYAYDPVGNITRIDDPKEGTTNLRYDALNRLIEQSLPNGVVGTFSYDSTSRITDVRYATTSGTLVSMDYEFGLTSAPERITFEDGSYLEYEFDDAFRLSKEEFFSAIDQVMASYLYEYDSVGNRDQTSRNGITTQSEFGPGGKLVSSQSNSTNTAYSYDEDGRLRASNVDGVMTEYEFDALDQLVEVLLPESQGSVEYTYDALGRRVAARHGNTSVQYIVGPTLVEELESPHLATNRDGELIAGFAYFGEVPLVRYSATETIYYLTDPQGSVVGLTDQDGNLVARFKYTGFGELLTAEGSAAETPQELLGDYRFHGGWLEGKSNLYTFRDRVYDPVIGQFMSRDPVDADEFDPVTFSTYSYARNNPLAFRDPTGQIAIIGYAFKLAKTLIVAEAIDFVTGVISTQLVIPALRLVVPGFENSLLDRFIRGEGSRDFEKLMKQAICSGLGLVNADGFAWFEPRMTDKGRPVSNGTTCGEVNPAEESNRPPGLVRPDFLFSNSEPKKVGKSASHPPRSLVVGDFTLKLSSKLSKPRQLKVIRNHALRYQYVPVAVYFAFNAKRVDVVKMQSKFLPVKVFIFGVF